MDRQLVTKLFNGGALTGAFIQPAPLEPNKYILSFRSLNGEEAFLTHARRTEVKVYKRLNGAMKDVQAVGFKEVTIRFS